MNKVTENSKVTIYWPDYTVTRAETATQALEKIGLKQWKMLTDVGQIKRMLARRASIWSNATVDPETPSHEFLRQLGESGMVFVWFGDGDPFLGTDTVVI